MYLKVEGESGHTNKDCPFYQEENTEEKVCICDPKVEGESGHTNKDCPFYQEENTDEKVCICDPKVEGETGHINKDCPFYKEEVPTEIEEAKALIEKLPSLEEINQWKPTLELTEEDEGYQEAYDAAISAHREELRKQIQEARAAYDALDEEQKKAFDQGLIGKLTSLETKLSQPVIDMESRLSALPSVEEFQNWKPVLDIPENAPDYQTAYDVAVAAHRKEVEEQVNAVREAYDILTLDQQAVLDPALVAKMDALIALLTQAVPLTGTLTEVYVSGETGSNETGDGTSENPFASLAKAVDSAAQTAIIHIMTDITSGEIAYINNKNITITSDGGKHTITRAEEFSPNSDRRSWYNPAMIEVADGGSLRLENIILDDAGKYEGTVFAQAISGGNTEKNLECVQDAIIASYSNRSTITLGSGTELKNYGGMSAVRVTDGAKLIMESGSKIYDNEGTDHPAGGSKGEGGVGPAGAVWSQTGIVTMNAGSEISNMVGRAFYMDGGSVTISGTIHGLTGNTKMWQGEEGIAIHLRGGASATLTGTGKIQTIKGGWLAKTVLVTPNGNNQFVMEQGSLIEDIAGVAVSGTGDAESGIRTLSINGKISNVHDGFCVIHCNSDTSAWNWNIGENAEIIAGKNSGNSIFYIQGPNITVDINGKVDNQLGNSGPLWIGANFDVKQVKISGHAKILAPENKEAITVNRGKFVVESGTITGGTSANGAIVYNGNGDVSTIDLQGGSLTGGKYDIVISKGGIGNLNHYITIANAVNCDNNMIYLDKYGITLDRPAEGVKFGNASPDVVGALTQASTHKGWSEDELASLWYYSSKPTTFILSKPAGLESNLPVYVAVTETGVDGKLPPEGKVTFYSVIEENGNWKVNLPASATNGSAIALVQPTSNYGSLTLTAPEEFYRASESKEDCNIPYTATYQLSENLKNQIDQLSNVKFVFDVDSGLKIDSETVSVSGNGFNKTGARYENGKLTIECTVDSAAANSAAITEIKWTGVLPNDLFGNGDKVLEAKGELTAQLATREATNISVPSNLVTTKLLYADQFIIKATAGTGGSISPSGDVTVMQGKDQTFTITPNSGYVIDDVKVDGISKGAVPTYTFTEVQDNHIIEATFRLAGTTPEPEDPDHPGDGENNDTNNTNNTNTSDEDSRVPHINLENIKDKDVPLEDLLENNLPEDDTTIDDGEVPLKPVPNTGDMIPVAAMAAVALSLGGVIVLSRKRK